MERVIIVTNNDGDIVGAVKPLLSGEGSAKNTARLIEEAGEFATEVVIVNSWLEWDDYQTTEIGVGYDQN